MKTTSITTTKNEDDLKKNKNEDDLKKNEKKNEDDSKKKNQFLIPLKFRPNLSWDWLSSLRFFQVIILPLTWA